MIVAIHQDTLRNTYIKDVPPGCIFQCCKSIFMVVNGFLHEENTVTCIFVEPLTGDIMDYNMIYYLKEDMECTPLVFDLWISAEKQDVNFGSLKYGETFMSGERAYILLSSEDNYEVICLNDGQLVEETFGEELLVKKCDIAFQITEKLR